MKLNHLLISILFLLGCSNGTPQVDFLKKLSGDELFPGVVLKINGSTSTSSNVATPTLDISGFSSATKIEIFSNDTCDSTAKITEVTTSSSATSTSLTAPALSADGVYYYYAIVTSSLGVASDCSKNRAAYTYDTIAPSTPSSVTLVTSTHNTATPVLQVAGVEEGANVNLFSDSTCSTSISAQSLASTTTVNVTSNAIAEGLHNYYALVVDTAGNSSACTSTAATYVYDITAPAVPSSLALASGTVSPSNNATPSFDIGGLVSGDTVKVYSDSLCLTEISSASVSATTMTVATLPALASDGSYAIHAIALDAYGNASACSSATVNYTLDRTPPAKPSAIALKTPATSPGNIATPTFTISGVVVNDVVALYSDSTCTTQITSATVTSGTTIDLTSNTLTQSTHDFYAQSTDPAGNASGCSTVKATYIYDNTPPNQPSSLVLSSPASSPSNVTTPTITVGTSFVSGDIVKLYSDASCSTAVSAPTTVTGGTGTVNISVTSALSTSATYNYYARAYDTAGNFSSCSSASLAYVFDNVAPTTPSSIVLTTPSTSPNNIANITLTVNGTTSGDSIYVYSNATCTTLVTSTAATTGATTVAISSLTEGIYTFYALGKDSAGNASACTATPANYTLDVTPPAAPSSLALVSSNPGKIATPMFQANGVVVGDTVGLYQDAACTSLITSGVASSTSILLTSGAVSNSNITGTTYNYYTASKDPAGNSSGCTGPTSYTYDNISPTVTSVTSVNVDRIYGPGATISLTLDMSEAVNVNTSAGSPTLTLNTTPARTATYASGSGTNQLVFTYTVQLGDASSDLDYASTTALTLNGGLIADLAGNNLSATMGAPGGTSSLAFSRAIIINPNPPSVTLVGTPTLRLNEGGSAQTMTLSLSFPATYDMTVHIATYSNAIAGVDYLLSTNTITISSGATSATFTFTPMDNGIVDSPRRVLLSVDSVDGTYLGMINKISQKDIYLIDNDQSQFAVQALAKSSVNYHQCALKSDGNLYCWGLNNYGQLGDNSTTTKSTPSLVSSISNVSSVATGLNHTCAIDSTGYLWCWGNGINGQLGLGVSSSRIIPYQVGFDTYQKVAAGAYHTCAIKQDSTLWCWGNNSYRQLGDGTSLTQQLSPSPVFGGYFFKDVFAGFQHTCGITTSDQLLCWGDNAYAQADGSGTISSYVSTPTLIDSGTTYSKAALGQEHTCAQSTSGQLKCFGRNSSGQLGNGSTGDLYIPTSIIASGVSAITAGASHTCAIISGALKCWGIGYSGQLGNGSNLTSTSPSAVSGSFASVAGANTHTCGLLNDGSMKCWGANNYNQNGTGKEDFVKNVTLVESNYKAISNADAHSCGLTNDNAVRCWGQNLYGQIGDGTQVTRTSPVLVIPNGVSQIATGTHGSCAVFSSGKLQCWGYNISGRLGDGTTTYRTRPTDIIASGVAQVSMGPDSTCALMTSGAVQCWGANGTYGKVGNASTTLALTPTQVIASGATAVSVGNTHACALVNTKVFCWGDNSRGQYGNNTTIYSNIPFDTGLTMSKISVGNNYTCGIQGTDLFCWGSNSYFQLANPAAVDNLTPYQVDLGTAYSEIATSTYHTCGVTSGRTMKCWGNNSNGQIGAGSGATPTILISSGVDKASLGLSSSCALMANSDVKCIGSNGAGQLGLGNLSLLYVPLDVFGF